jgi:hypothetical protein
LFSILVFSGCKSNEEKKTLHKIEKAHQKKNFSSKQAIQYDFKLGLEVKKEWMLIYYSQTLAKGLSIKRAKIIF